MTASTRPDTPPLAPVRAWRKRPVTIEAVQWDGTAAGATPIIEWVLDGDGTARFHEQIPAFVTGDREEHPAVPAHLAIDVVGGVASAEPGDWIIRGVEGEFYPCPRTVFEATYEPADALESRECTDPECAYFGQPHLAAFPHRHTEELRGRGRERDSAVFQAGMKLGRLIALRNRWRQHEVSVEEFTERAVAILDGEASL